MISPLMLIGLIPKIPKKWLLPIIIGVTVIALGFFVKEYIETKAELSVAQVELKEFKRVNKIIFEKKVEQEERIEALNVELSITKGGLDDIKNNIPEARVFLNTTADDTTHDWMRKRNPIN